MDRGEADTTGGELCDVDTSVRDDAIEHWREEEDALATNLGETLEAEEREPLSHSGSFVSSVGIAKETMTILESGGYDIDEKWVDIAAAQSAAQEGTTYHPSGCRVADPRPTTSVSFVAASSFAAAAECARAGSRVCVLNFASARNPGGGFLTGASAQEEDLCRASGLYPTLLPHWEFYDRPPLGLNTDRMIYSPMVPVFRDEAWELLQKPFCVDIVTAAAVQVRSLRFDDRSKVDAVMQRRIRKLLGLCQTKGASSLVLGAWGTGAFGLDPWRVASCFKQALGAAHFEEAIFPLLDPVKRQIFEAAFAGEGPVEKPEARNSRSDRKDRKMGGINQHRRQGTRRDDRFDP